MSKMFHMLKAKPEFGTPRRLHIQTKFARPITDDSLETKTEVKLCMACFVCGKTGALSN